MKKKHSLCHKIFGLLHRELEATLAVLVVLAFVFGYSFAADPDLGSGDTEQVIEYTSNFVVNGVPYSSLNFTASNQAGKYRVRDGFNKGNIIQTPEGTRGAANGDKYTYTLTLGQPMNARVYLYGSYSSATINGQTVTSPAMGVLVNGSTITIGFTGGSDFITALSKISGTSATSVKAPVETLFVLPNTASVGEGQQRSFNIVALDTYGNSVIVSPIWTVTQGIKFATIDAKTGVLTGVTAGGPVTIKASYDGVTASASVTVKPNSATALERIMEQTKNQEKASTGTKPIGTGGEKDQASDEIKSPGADEDQILKTGNLEKDDVVSKNGQATQDALALFAETKIAERLQETGGKSTTPTQARINAVVQAQNTFTQKVAVRFTAAAREIGATIKQILVGQIVRNEAGETYRIKSVAQHLGDLIRRLFFGGTATEQEPGAGAGSGLMRLEGGEGGGGEQN